MRTAKKSFVYTTLWIVAFLIAVIIAVLAIFLVIPIVLIATKDLQATLYGAIYNK